MNKVELIQGLHKFINTRKQKSVRWKGQQQFAQYLVFYLQNLTIPSDEEYDFWRIEDHLPQILVNAWESFRTSPDPIALSQRKKYQEELMCEVPNITSLGASPILDQVSAVQTTLGYLMKEVTGYDWIEESIDKYVKAEFYLVQQRFDKFLRVVYKRGMFKIIKESPERGMSGTFGSTELRTYVIAGRTMFTFVHKNKGGEESLSFVSDDVDPNGLSAGIQSVYTDLAGALGMIDDIITNWPSDTTMQKRLFTAN